jgi:hypothetical protein
VKPSPKQKQKCHAFSIIEVGVIDAVVAWIPNERSFVNLDGSLAAPSLYRLREDKTPKIGSGVDRGEAGSMVGTPGVLDLAHPLDPLEKRQGLVLLSKGS